MQCDLQWSEPLKTASEWLEDEEGSDTVECKEDFTVLNDHH
jgi:hypothetical protein